MVKKQTLAILALGATAFAGSAPAASVAATTKKYKNFRTSFHVRCAYVASGERGVITCRNARGGAGFIGKTGYPGLVANRYAALPLGTLLKPGERWAVGKNLRCVIAGRDASLRIECRNKTRGFTVSRKKVTEIKPKPKA